MSQSALYPVMLNLKGKRCIVVGGGEVACRKVKRLLECGAKVTVISPELVTELEEMKKEGKIIHFPREYQQGDVKDSFLVIGATQNKSVNKKVAREARKMGVVVNVVDSPFLCDFFVPSIFKKGKLTVSISTEGASPALAKRIREELEEIYGEEYGEFLDWMQQVRGKVIKKIKDQNRREEIFYRLVDSKVLDLFKKGKREKVREYLRQLVQEEGNKDKICG